MSKRSRRKYTTEQKVAILRRHLVDRVPVSELCNELGLQPSVFYQWQRQVHDNLGGALTTPAADGPSKRVVVSQLELVQVNVHAGHAAGVGRRRRGRRVTSCPKNGDQSRVAAGRYGPRLARDM
jgi:transposase-like protein